jgi:hypothetical protein
VDAIINVLPSELKVILVTIFKRNLAKGGAVDVANA